MSTRRSNRPTAALGLLGLLLLGAPLPAAVCDLDVQPAATLLAPYFAVDLGDPEGMTTLVAVANAFPRPALARVTLWTNLAVPSLGFDVYLTGYDVQTLNLRDVFVHGRLPETGFGISSRGELSEPHEIFPGCSGAPGEGEAELSAAELAHLRSRHLGEASPLDGLCGALPDRGWATGYLTIDVVRRCAGLSPADPEYFSTGEERVAAEENILWGDVLWVDSREDFAQSEPLVHVEAFPGGFGSGDATFYGRYVDGSGADAREPLATIWAVRFLAGGPFDGGTELVVWRDTGSPAAEAFACAERPGWYPLPGARLTGFDEEENIVFRDEHGAAGEIGESRLLERATERLALPPSSGVGFARLDLGGDSGLQSWVGAVLSARGRFSVGHRATRLDSVCAPPAP